MSNLLMDMTSVLLYELCKSDVIRSQFAEAIQDTGFTRMKERQVLRHLQKSQTFI